MTLSPRVARGVMVGLLFSALGAGVAEVEGQEARPRARDVGIDIGVFDAGPLNAITDVGGVRVGHRTLIVGDSIRTGVTAVLPHGDDIYANKVRGAIVVRNGFGKLVGLSQVNELGQIETPILLTGTLSVFRAADALVDTLLALPENADVRSINPVVGETNDGYLSDIRARPIQPEHVREALRVASTGPVEEGSVGAGTGTRALGWKGGIGTASRQSRCRPSSRVPGCRFPPLRPPPPRARSRQPEELRAHAPAGWVGPECRSDSRRSSRLRPG